jgi:hypothetical protein
VTCSTLWLGGAAGHIDHKEVMDVAISYLILFQIFPVEQNFSAGRLLLVNTNM